MLTMTGLISILYESRNVFLWTGILFSGLIWPHIAFYLAKVSPSPKEVEYRNLLIDGLIYGVWMTVISFQIVPTISFLLGVFLDNMSTGGFKLFVKGIGFILIGIIPPLFFVGWVRSLSDFKI